MEVAPGVIENQFFQRMLKREIGVAVSQLESFQVWRTQIQRIESIIDHVESVAVDFNSREIVEI